MGAGHRRVLFRLCGSPLAYICSIDGWVKGHCCVTLHTAQSHTHNGCHAPKPKEPEENELQI